MLVKFKPKKSFGPLSPNNLMLVESNKSVFPLPQISDSFVPVRELLLPTAFVDQQSQSPP